MFNKSDNRPSPVDTKLEQGQQRAVTYNMHNRHSENTTNYYQNLATSNGIDDSWLFPNQDKVTKPCIPSPELYVPVVNESSTMYATTDTDSSENIWGDFQLQYEDDA